VVVDEVEEGDDVDVEGGGPASVRLVASSLPHPARIPGNSRVASAAAERPVTRRA
jgi:hypothetical protein